MTNKMDRAIFDSIGELGARVNELQTNRDRRRCGNESTNIYNSSFYGDMGIGAAIEMADAGGNWQEGADAMPVINIDHKALNGGEVETPTMFNNIQGFAPNVPGFLSGTPDSMLDMHEPLAGTKLLRVAVHVGRTHKAGQAQVLNRGAAIMAVLDQLSREGYSIELWAIWRNNDWEDTASVETCIKHGTDYWTPSSVAFALAHVAFQRRLCWRVAESMTDGGQNLTDGGYGSGDGADFSDFDLSYGYMTAPSDYRTTTSAIDNIKASTLAQLAKLAA
jgi:hypothetical protein